MLLKDAARVTQLGQYLLADADIIAINIAACHAVAIADSLSLVQDLTF